MVGDRKLTILEGDDRDDGEFFLLPSLLTSVSLALAVSHRRYLPGLPSFLLLHHHHLPILPSLLVLYDYSRSLVVSTVQ